MLANDLGANQSWLMLAAIEGNLTYGGLDMQAFWLRGQRLKSCCPHITPNETKTPLVDAAGSLERVFWKGSAPLDSHRRALHPSSPAAHMVLAALRNVAAHIHGKPALAPMMSATRLQISLLKMS